MAKSADRDTLMAAMMPNNLTITEAQR